MALEIRLNDKFYEEELKFTDFGLEPFNVVLSDLESFRVEDLAKKMAMLQNKKEINEEDIKEIEDLTNEILVYIWKDKIDFYKTSLPNKIFDAYTSSLIIDITCTVVKSTEKSSQNIVKKHKLATMKN